MKAEMKTQTVTKVEFDSFELESAVYSLSVAQRKILKIMLKLAEPTTTSRIRYALISIAEVSSLMKIDRFSRDDLIIEALDGNKRLIDLRKKNIRVPSYSGVETELRILEERGFISKQEERRRKSKYLWLLNTEFVKAYLKRKAELSKELAVAVQKDEENKIKDKSTNAYGHSTGLFTSNGDAFFNAHPAEVLDFFGVD